MGAGTGAVSGGFSAGEAASTVLEPGASTASPCRDPVGVLDDVEVAVAACRAGGRQ